MSPDIRAPEDEEREALTPLYDRWMLELLEAPIPREANATCDDCAMLPPEGDRRLPLHDAYFDPRTKCCTYLPELPSFLVGAILRDGDEAGRTTLAERMADPRAVSPLGVGFSGEYTVRTAGGSAAEFGRDAEHRCPHYASETGLCTIWRQRNGVCATFFCKHVRGATGLRFWSGLRHLLSLVEQALAYQCALELDIDPDGLHALLLPPDPQSREARLAADPVRSASSPLRLWGRWHDRREEFFVATWERVSGMSLADVLACCGPEVATVARAVQHNHARLVDPEPPARLVPGPYTVLDTRPDGVVVAAYSGADPLRLPRVVLDLLPLFDGRRSTTEVLDGLRSAGGLRVNPSLVRKLADFGILVPAP